MHFCATMYNDPELNPKYLGTISSDFVKVAETLKEASYTIRKHDFSKYPVFPMCRIAQPIGQVLVEAFQAKNEWNYYASFMEEFTQRGLIANAARFTENYKNPDEFCCLFVVDKTFTKFVFIPYPIDTSP